MKPQKIKKIINEKLDELSGLYEKINPDFNKDAIHDFRVAVKTLRSFLRLLRSDNGDKRLKLPKKFKRLYHITGAIRDGQLELEKLSCNYPVLSVYLDNSCQITNRRKYEWQKRCSKNVLQKFRASLRDIEYKTVAPVAMANFVNLKMISIIKLSSIKYPTDNQLHSIRKSAKDILYAAKLAKKKWKPGYKQIPDFSMRELERIAYVIGEYNDGRIIHDHMKSFHSKKMEPEEKTVIEKLYDDEAKKLKCAKKNALAIVRNFLKIG